MQFQEKSEDFGHRTFQLFQAHTCSGTLNTFYVQVSCLCLNFPMRFKEYPIVRACNCDLIKCIMWVVCRL